jgi:hypothetical protein
MPISLAARLRYFTTAMAGLLAHGVPDSTGFNVGAVRSDPSGSRCLRRRVPSAESTIRLPSWTGSRETWASVTPHHVLNSLDQPPKP